MPPRRILSLWFPRLAAERVLRAEPGLAGQPLAVVADARGALVLASLDAVAEAAGLRRGMALGDARAICPGLVTRPEDPCREAAFLAALRRWAGGFSPWAAAEGARGAGARRHRLRASLRRRGGDGRPDRGRGGGLRPQPRARARRHARRGLGGGALRRGGELAGRMPATPSTRRRGRPARGPASGAGPGRRARSAAVGAAARVVPPGETLARIGPLPVAALRLERAEVETLQALGLRRIVDLVRAAAGAARPAGGAGGARAARPGARAGGRAGGGGPSAAGLRGAADPARADRARGGRAGRDRPAAAAPLRPARRPPAGARGGCG